MSCYKCDGTGESCNICGDPPGACTCPADVIRAYEEDYGEQFGPCVDCDGTGE